MVDITSCPSNTSALSTSTEKSRKQSSENKSTVVQQTFNEYLLWVRNRLSARDTLEDFPGSTSDNESAC